MSENKELVVKEEELDLALVAVAEGEEEHLSQDELSIPFLKVAQKGSPQVDEDKPEYIKGLKTGDYFNTVSLANYGNTLKVQVHGYFHNYTIWKGEKGSGEFQGTMTTEEFRAFEKSNALTRDGGDMVQSVDGEQLRYTDTHNFIVSLPEYEEEGIMIYPLTSTGCKAARTWNTLNNGRRIKGRPAKRYMTLWEIATAGFESNGFTYKQTSKIKALGWVNAELADFGHCFEDFVKSIKEQGVKYSEGSEENTTDSSEY